MTIQWELERHLYNKVCSQLIGWAMNIAQHLTGIELDKLYATAQFYIFPVPFCDFANSLFLAKGDGDTPISVHRRCRASSISLVCCHKKYFIFFRMESSFICCHKKIKNKKNIYGLVGGQYILYICRYRVDLFIHITSKGFWKRLLGVRSRIWAFRYMEVCFLRYLWKGVLEIACSCQEDSKSAKEKLP